MSEDSGWPPLTGPERKLLRAYLACPTNCVEAFPLESSRWCQH